MNRLYFLSLLVISLIASPGLLDAQISSTDLGGGRTIGITGLSGSSYPAIKPGAHVPLETIYTFSDPKDKAALGPFIANLTALGATGFDTSPSGKYLKADWDNGYPNGVDYCSIIGEGTTGSLSSAQGTGVDLNYIVGVTPISMGAPIQCMDFNYIDNPIDGTRTLPDFSEYSPLEICPTPHNSIVPEGDNEGSVVKVAIIDSGFGNNYFTGLGGRPVSQQYSGTSGQNEHGDIIASIIAGQAHAAGVADRIQLYSYQVLNENLRGDIWTVIKALEEAALPENGINIVNLSLSFPAALPCSLMGVGDFGLEPDLGGEPAPNDPVNSLLYGPLKALQEANILVINAAGNDGTQLGPDHTVFPAMEDGLYNLITVGALGCGQDQIAGWSNQGSQYIELYAPGSDITPYFNCGRSVFGTSFAAPIVSAAAAIHATTLPSFSVYDILCYLESSAEPLPGASWGILGVGINNACNKSTPVSGKSFSGSSTVDRLTATPNPFNNELMLKLPSGEEGEATYIRLLDVNGKVFLQQSAKGESVSLDTNTLPQGVYFVNIRNSKVNETTTVVRR